MSSPTLLKMADDETIKDASKETASEKEPPAEGAEQAPGDQAAEGPGAEPASREPEPAEGGVPKLEMSDDLRKALKEAEEHLTSSEKADKKDGLDFPEEEERPEPEAPSQKEMELKLEVLNLRQKLREKEKEAEQRLKELKQNLETAKHTQKMFDSYKARVQKEKADQFNYGHEPLLKELLRVIDNLELALKHAGDEEAVKGLKEGVDLTLKMFTDILDKFGVFRIDPSGKKFNPEFHQAMSQVENDSVENGTVLEVQQKGYMLKDRLLRPAMVVVSSNTEEKEKKKKKSQQQKRQENAESEKGQGKA